MSKKNPHALIAQLDRAFGYGPKGWEFESLWVHHDKRQVLYLPFIVVNSRNKYV